MVHKVNYKTDKLLFCELNFRTFKYFFDEKKIIQALNSNSGLGRAHAMAFAFLLKTVCQLYKTKPSGSVFRRKANHLHLNSDSFQSYNLLKYRK